LDIAGILSQVDGERLYKHVLRLEGTRHPIDTPEKLNEAADYILSEFKQYGLAAKEQTFQVEGFPSTFRNIEATIGKGSEPELLIVSHYDTVENCPGADDNASAVAVMLETARVLAGAENAGNTSFVSFTLEELNPSYLLKARQIAQRLGLKDSQNRYTSMRTHETMKKLLELQRKHWRTGKTSSEAFAEARIQMQTQMTDTEVKYVQELEELYKGIKSWMGATATVGSASWVEEAIRTKRKLMGVLCFDTIGYTSEKEHSQTIPADISPEIFQTQNVQNATTGNFLAVFGDANSDKLIQTFRTQSGLDSVNLPCACLQVPLSYQQIEEVMRDLLRSDHAPFWQREIPGLLLTDTADLRNPYYHTPADTIEKLNFDFITRICKATIATAIQTAQQ